MIIGQRALTDTVPFFARPWATRQRRVNSDDVGGGGLEETLSMCWHGTFFRRYRYPKSAVFSICGYVGTPAMGPGCAHREDAPLQTLLQLAPGGGGAKCGTTRFNKNSLGQI